MKLHKKENLIDTKLFISRKFTISKIHKNFTICVTRMRDEDQTHMHNVHKKDIYNEKHIQ